MENTPEAAPQGTEATPQNTNPEPTQAPEINAEQVAKFLGTDTETFGKFQKFVEANGKFDSAFSKMKADISNPQPQKVVETPQTASEPQNNNQPTSHTETAPEPFKTPQGAITAQEFLAEQYFKSLAGEEKYANIADGVRNGDYLKEMSAFGIQPLNPDGSINDQKVRMYLDLKSQTVPAKPTETTPDASAAPTVTYTEVGENGITSMDQAYKIIMEPNNPNAKAAEEYIKKSFAKQ